MPLTPTEINAVKSAIAQHGSAHCTFGEVTVVNLHVGNEVVARFKLTMSENPAVISDLVVGAANDTVPCYLVMPGVLRRMFSRA